MQRTLTKTILSLCDYSGIWSQPYLDAGYDVVRIDLQHGQDVRLMEFPGAVHGILAAPPCRVFCRPGARLWEQWGDKELLDGLSIVDACLRVVAVCRPAWWALENPPGRLDKYLGPPSLSFHPWEFGDAYTKHTYLWGDFSPLTRAPVEPEPYPENLRPGRRDRTSRMSSSWRDVRAQTPPGEAFLIGWEFRGCLKQCENARDVGRMMGCDFWPEEWRQELANAIAHWNLGVEVGLSQVMPAILRKLDEADEVERVKADAFALEHEHRELKTALKNAGLVAQRIGTKLIVFGGSGK